MDSKALHQELHRARRAQLSDQPLRQIFRARHLALTRSPGTHEARSRESAWLERSPSYRDARAAGTPHDTEAIDANGITLVVPQATASSGLARRLREGWLPWRDILAQRELGLGRVMIDIGANIGTTSILRVILGDVQTVHAIEPEPANFRCLVHNVVANGLAGFVLPDSCAISSSTGSALLRHASGLGAHRLLSDKAARRRTEDTLAVDTWTLDDWIGARELDPHDICFVKVDTQGWESHVLVGATQLLAQHHVAWVLEISPKHLDAAGTPLTELIERLQRHFTHAIDLRPDHSKSRVIAVREIAEALGYLAREGPNTYTNLVVYHES